MVTSTVPEGLPMQQLGALTSKFFKAPQPCSLSHSTLQSVASHITDRRMAYCRTSDRNCSESHGPLQDVASLADSEGSQAGKKSARIWTLSKGVWGGGGPYGCA